MKTLKDFLQWPLLRNTWMLFSLWMLMVVISVGLHMHKFNNFLIYKFTFWHAIDGKSIFENFGDHGDVNHYGPIFSLIIMPFALVSGTATSLDSISLDGCVPLASGFGAVFVVGHQGMYLNYRTESSCHLADCT